MNVWVKAEDGAEALSIFFFFSSLIVKTVKTDKKPLNLNLKFITVFVFQEFPFAMNIIWIRSVELNSIFFILPVFVVELKVYLKIIHSHLYFLRTKHELCCRKCHLWVLRLMKTERNCYKIYFDYIWNMKWEKICIVKIFLS